MENYTIISGFARGIDQTAHEYAKKTIAVFAGGIDQIYPPNSIFLYEKLFCIPKVQSGLALPIIMRSAGE